MEFQDLKNTKHIKVIATTSIATVAVATSTAPVLAQGDRHQSSDYGRNHTSQSTDYKDNEVCDDDEKPVKATPTPTPIPKPTPAPTAAPTPTPAAKPVASTTQVTTTPTTTITPAATVAAPATEQPKELPKTGPTEAVAVGGLAAIGGYLGNLFRLKRRNQK